MSRHSFITAFLIISLLFFFFTCEQNPTESKTKVPELVTYEVTEITGSTATCGGNITDDGGATVTARGVCWSTGQTPKVSDNKTNDGNGAGSFTSHITGLTGSTIYYVRAYATNSSGTGYGSTMSFATDSVPTVVTAYISSITYTSAQSGGTVKSDGGATVTARGVCWSTDQAPTTSDNKTTNGSGTGSFTSNMTGLSAGTTYYVRAYATNSVGTGYGDVRSFKALSTSVPTVTTASVSSVTYTTAQCGGTITSDGGSAVTARGVCWSTNQTPTTSDNKTNNGTGTGIFTSNITGLSAGTTYYVRAYATNSVGTGYGDAISFKTLSTSLPTVSTASVSSVTYTTAQCGGTITSDGGAAVTARGVCWSTNQTPTTSDNKTNNGSGTGSFASNITGLSAGTTYYVRAYATNSVGTGYGDVRSFKALSTSLPTVSTASVSSVTGTTAQCGGTIASDGGAAVTARGVCWSTNQTPTTSDNKTNNGSGTGSFASNITGLSAGTTYHVRAYATNSVGTGYGSVMSFTTPGTMIDIDGNVYQTVKIGDQWWMAENLKVTHYRNGATIPVVTNSDDWYNLSTGARCAYGNDQSKVATYGYLYNWYAVDDSREIAPSGWHVPSDAEWKELEMYLGMSQSEADGTGYRGTDEGGKLKEAGTTHWNSPNEGATNESGFAALPGGYRDSGGNFGGLGSNAAFWSSAGHNSDLAWSRTLHYDNAGVYRYGDDKRYGFSVRLVRD